jgi:protein dithiol:quinone oxidoreductase
MHKNLSLLIGFTCAFLLCFALYIQHVGWQGVHFPPCPLCILQRVAFLFLMIFSLSAFIVDKFKSFFYYASLLVAVLGLMVALRHQWVLIHPESSCGLDPLETFINQFSIVQALPFFFKADGFCSTPLPPIFFLSVPSWSLLFFSIFLIFLLFKPKLNR